MNKILSQAEPGRVLHVIVDAATPFDGRIDLSTPNEPIQVSAIAIPPGKKVNPHIHNPRSQEGVTGAPITQECWIVLRGQIEVSLFDLDRKPLRQQSLSQGSILVTFYGGHSLEGAAEGAVIVECKNGPYLGRDYTAF
jgi:cupin fold WbuC family metalloprotein